MLSLRLHADTQRELSVSTASELNDALIEVSKPFEQPDLTATLKADETGLQATYIVVSGPGQI